MLKITKYLKIVLYYLNKIIVVSNGCISAPTESNK
jgi:hypothetical protein